MDIREDFLETASQTALAAVPFLTEELVEIIVSIADGILRPINTLLAAPETYLSGSCQLAITPSYLGFDFWR